MPQIYDFMAKWINKVKWTQQMPGLKREREYDKLYLKT